MSTVIECQVTAVNRVKHIFTVELSNVVELSIMNRYLMHLSYLGSSFKGVARVPPFYNFGDRSTIQGEIEIALRNLSPVNVNNIEIETSSRTDAGVHALHTTLHVDLANKTGRPFDPNHVTEVMNKRFQYTNTSIRILKTELVDATYHVRENVAQRSYLYRLAVARKSFESLENAIEANLFRPIEDVDRCYFMHNLDFDIERMKRVAPLFLGKHDFRTFMRPSIEEKTRLPSFAVRTVKSLTIEESEPACMTSERQSIAADTYQFWNIRIQGRSFLYRQVRKIIGTLIAVAEGRLSEKDVYEMITIPSYGSWPFGVVFTAPANGLFLTGVEYEEPEVEEDVMSADATLGSQCESIKM